MTKAKSTSNQLHQLPQKISTEKTKNKIANSFHKKTETDDYYSENIYLTKDYLFFGDVIESIDQYITDDYKGTMNKDDNNDMCENNQNIEDTYVRRYTSAYTDSDDECKSEKDVNFVAAMETESYHEFKFKDHHKHDVTSECGEINEECDEKVSNYYYNMMDDISNIVYILEKKNYFSHDIKKINEQIKNINQNGGENCRFLKLSLRTILVYLENIYNTVNSEEF
jgi:hypothetical protein